MKLNLIKVTLAALTLSTAANAQSNYDDPSVILTELTALSVECAGMADGQVNEEIFGIQFIRTGERCTLGHGEIDPRVAEFLAEKGLSWAGIVNEGSIWVSSN